MWTFQPRNDTGWGSEVVKYILLLITMPVKLSTFTHTHSRLHTGTHIHMCVLYCCLVYPYYVSLVALCIRIMSALLPCVSVLCQPCVSVLCQPCCLVYPYYVSLVALCIRIMSALCIRIMSALLPCVSVLCQPCCLVYPYYVSPTSEEIKPHIAL